MCVIFIEYKYSGVHKALKYCSTLCVGRTLYVDQPRWCQPPPPPNMLCGVTIVCRERGRAPICIQISNEYLYVSNKYLKIFHIVTICFVLNLQETRVGLTLTQKSLGWFQVFRKYVKLVTVLLAYRRWKNIVLVFM